MLGIFDSGLGGLTVVKEVIRQMPDLPFLYLGDTARTPYGNKSREMVENYALGDTKFLMEKGAQIIIVACNTASTNAMEVLRKNFSLPIFEVVTPAVKEALKVSTKKRIAVIGTRATINSGIYEKKIKELGGTQMVVTSQACPLLVSLVEEGWLDEAETKRIVKKYLQGLKTKNVDTLILGCTHYPLIKKIIQKAIGKRVRIIDSAQSVAQEVKKYLDSHVALKEEILKDKASNAAYFVTDITPHFQQIAEKFLSNRIKLEKVVLE